MLSNDALVTAIGVVVENGAPVIQLDILCTGIARLLPHRFEIFGRPVCGAPRCPRSERRDLDRAERFEDVRNVDGGVGALLLQLDHQGLRLCVGLRGATGRRILNPWGG